MWVLAETHVGRDSERGKQSAWPLTAIYVLYTASESMNRTQPQYTPDATPVIDTDEPAARLRSRCPVAGALDLVGDRWTLLVVRDLLRGKRRYGDLAASSERIPTNILADRLKRLERVGIIERVQYSERPPRYEYHLTERGNDLRPAISSLAEWGVRYVPGTRKPDDGRLASTADTATDSAAN